MVTLFGFLLAIELLGSGFKLFNLEVNYLIFSSTSNPFVALLIGILATAIFQSSSTVTSVLVALVGAGTINLENAVPIVMGANIGTTVTSTIVALNFFGTRKQLRRAFSAATCHDFFNIITALVLFPAEMLFGALSRSARLISDWITPENFDGSKSFSVLGLTVKPTAEYISELLQQNSYAILTLAVFLVVLTIALLSATLKRLILPKDEIKLNKLFFPSRFRAFLWGLGITSAIQSSSVTTSIVVPYVALNKVPLFRAFPFIIGANVGTTFTALIAAVSQSQAAIAIALCHLIFNVFGSLLHLPHFMSRFTLMLAMRLGDLVMRFRASILIYMILFFFGLPVALIVWHSGNVTVAEYTYMQVYADKPQPTFRVVMFQDKEKGGPSTLRVYDKLSEDYQNLDSMQYFESTQYNTKNPYLLPDLALPSGFTDSCDTFSFKEHSPQICFLDSGFHVLAQYSRKLTFVHRYSYVDKNLAPADSQVLWIEPGQKLYLGRQVFRNGKPYMQEDLRKKSP